MRVLYVTVVPLMSGENGGSICCRNHVARLASDPGIELFAMVAGPLAWKEGTDTFFADLGVTYHFQPFREGNFRHSRNTPGAIREFITRSVFQFPWEVQSFNQEHIEEGVAWAVKAYGIDVVLVDYHASALFLRLPRTDARTALISLNREGDFYADQIRLGQTHHGSLTAAVSLARCRRWERRTDASVDLVVAIGPPDLPRHPVRRPPVVITPFLDRKADRWAYGNTKRLLFVGAYAHYPNRLAIEWITACLAPRLLALRADAKVVIIGADATQVKEEHRYGNLEFLGLSDAATVAQQFRTCDVMLCPVENDFGVKFKALARLIHDGAGLGLADVA